jgi:hypothetical protein
MNAIGRNFLTVFYRPIEALENQKAKLVMGLQGLPHRVQSSSSWKQAGKII